MTSELEKQFFDTFGIEPKKLNFKTMNCACGCHDCENCDKYKNNFSKSYPQITDRILLELICLCCKAFNLLNIELSVVFAFNIDEIKQSILTRLIWLDEVYHNKDIKHQVRTLFEEG
jgi:hypothetical protein